MRRFFKAFPVAAALCVIALPATADDDLLAALSAMGITVTDDLRQSVESGINSDDPSDIVQIIEALDGDLEAIAAVISAAVQARPDLSDQIVSAAIMVNPTAASVITQAAINALSDSSPSSQAMIVNIVTAAVKAAPAQAESIRVAAVASAPAAQDSINSAIDAAFPDQSDDDDQSGIPSPS